MTTTIGGHELALTIINDGAGYKRRKELGERGLFAAPLNAPLTRQTARDWTIVAFDGAAAYEKQFGSRGASCFTVQDILSAAVELSEYYEQHARENAQ